MCCQDAHQSIQLQQCQHQFPQYWTTRRHYICKQLTKTHSQCLPIYSNEKWNKNNRKIWAQNKMSNRFNEHIEWHIFVSVLRHAASVCPCTQSSRLAHWQSSYSLMLQYCTHCYTQYWQKHLLKFFKDIHPKPMSTTAVYVTCNVSVSVHVKCWRITKLMNQSINDNTLAMWRTWKSEQPSDAGLFPTLSQTDVCSSSVIMPAAHCKRITNVLLLWSSGNYLPLGSDR